MFGGNFFSSSKEIVMKTSSGIESVRLHFSRFAIATILVGAGLLAVASPAEAKVVHHSVDITINQGDYNLDLNNDGVTDFTITSETTDCRSEYLSETPATKRNNAILGPLAKGDEIGPDQVFSGGTLDLGWVKGGGPACQLLKWGGPWYSPFEPTRGYLGLSFQLKGETYYGWMALVVPRGRLTATLLGYAYETTPGTPINAGQTGDTEDDSALSPGPVNRDDFGLAASVTNPTQAVSLAMLALDDREVPLWRRKEPAGAAPENRQLTR
jgi:hypothetical protein